MTRIGIDVGSTYTKYCVLDDAGTVINLYSEKTPIRQKEYFEEKIAELRGRYGECTIVSCGYGRRNIPFDRIVNELAALAAGANRQYPTKRVILDIGGQDTKVIRQSEGRLREFFINEKCAAGCGMFLSNVLGLLGMELEEIDLSHLDGRSEIHLSSTCAVFAQSELVELIADNVPLQDIVRAVLRHIFSQARTLLRKSAPAPVLLSGGLSQIEGIEGFAEELLDTEVFVPDNGPFLSALGCALLADEKK